MSARQHYEPPAFGLAMQVRPHATVRTEGEYRGQFVDGVVEVTRFSDAALIDIMFSGGQISQAQHDVATRLAELWFASGLAPKTTGGYGRASGAALHESDRAPIDDYRAAMAILNGPEQFAVSDALWGSVLPGFRVVHFRDGLDRLAKELGW